MIKFLFSFLMVINIYCGNMVIAQAQKDYQPVFAVHWQYVVSYTHENWAAQVGKSQLLPHSYLSAWKSLPHMFYWDTHFINEGLLLTTNGLDSIAGNNILNLLFAIDSFGYIGNAVVTDWGMNRSQPPYLSAMVRSFYEQKGKGDTAFLRKAYFTLKKEYDFWTDNTTKPLEDHHTSVKALQRYSHHATRTELVELYRVVAERFHFPLDAPEEHQVKTAIPYAVEAGTGMDFTPRFEDRCPDFTAVDLNALLYTYEQNFAWMVNLLRLKDEPDWNKKAKQRKKSLSRYCWSDERGLFLDYDFVNKRHSKVAAITAFQPMWAGMATKNQAAALVKNLPLFETEFGMITTETSGNGKRYQWGETSVWAPMQLMLVQALDRYGYQQEAQRIAAKYLDLVTRNFLKPGPQRASSGNKVLDRKPGATYEKYDRNGNINDDEYLASEMMGWTTGAFLWLYEYVKAKN